MKMHELVDRFVAQLEESMRFGDQVEIKPQTREIQNIYVAGLGGSGIGADFVYAFVKDELKVPFMVGKGYEIPAWVGPNTLAICSSYSGNTEETLYSYELLNKSGAKIVVVSSGGKLVEKARAAGQDCLIVPADWPSPRACLGFSFLMQATLLNKLGLIGNNLFVEVAKAIDLIKAESEDIQAKAKVMAELLIGKIPVIYSVDKMEAVAVRFRQQINENGKMLCWHHVIPEMNHNELVGWRIENPNLAVVFIRNKDDFSRNSLRMDINKEIVNEYAGTTMEIYSKGDSFIQRALYLVHLTDYISCYLSDLRGVDSIEVKVIDYLKSELGKEPI